VLSGSVLYRRLKLSAAPVALVVLAACADRSPVGSLTPETVIPPPGTLQALTCTASISGGTVSCASADPASSGAAAAIIGGQNTNLKLTSSNVAYTAEDSIFRFDVTVQNLLNERLGTADGVNLHADGIRIFFAAGPTVTSGSGSISVADADGVGSFTGATQPYYQYNEILDKNEVSPARTWRLRVDPSVGTFTFGVYVATQVQPLLVINEMMANPGGSVQDNVGEYVELFNAGRFPVNLNGFVVNDNANVPDTVNIDLVVAGGGYVVLGRSADTSLNGGITVHYAYTRRIGTSATSLTLSNSGTDYFRLRAPSGVTVDSAGYTTAGTVAVSGVARELKNPSLDNTSVDGSNWAAAVSDYAASNKGTPGTANGTSTPLPSAGPAVTVTITPASATLTPGSTRQFSATARDSIGQITATTFTWTSLDSAVATVNATGLVSGVAVGQARIVAVSANGKADTATVTVEVPAGLSYLNHLEFGTPADGTPGNELIIQKPQFALSYSEVRGGPNWVAWNLNATHFGGANRCDCFFSDPQLPDSMYRVVTSDYTGSGYSRGHMVMSEQRTATPAENAVTFLMTNILPQIQDMNGGPWLDFEIHNNDLARLSNKELYIIAGGTYSATPATLKGAGIVQIPSTTWKIVVVMDRGEGLANVSSASDIQVIAVNMPNVTGIQNNPWTMYQTTVDAIEAATGYDFLALLPDAIEAAVEAN
jgi:DNA/RNA endonuclease G (NUC1)